MGAMLGASFGQIVNVFFPEIVAPSGAYALVGMAAFFSGAAHAPITAILILYEMTGDYQIILPLMLSTVISTIVSRNLSYDSIYSLKLKRRGVVLSPDNQSIDLMQGVTAEIAMNSETDAVSADMPVVELMSIFSSTHYHALPVVQNKTELIGVVTIRELENLGTRDSHESKIISDILTDKKPATILPHQPVWMALRHLEDKVEGCVPVISESGKNILLGVLRRVDVIRAYNKAVNERAQQQHHSEILKIRKLNQTGLTEVTLRPDSPIVGKRVRELHLGEDSLMVSVRRKGKLRIVRGETILHAGDQVTIFAEKPKADLLENYLNGTLVDSDFLEDSLVCNREIEIPPGSSVDGKSIRDLRLPKDCVLVKIIRNRHIILPRGDTVLLSGDTVEVFGVDEKLLEAEKYLIG